MDKEQLEGEVGEMAGLRWHYSGKLWGEKCSEERFPGNSNILGKMRVPNTKYLGVNLTRTELGSYDKNM